MEQMICLSGQHSGPLGTITSKHHTNRRSKEKAVTVFLKVRRLLADSSHFLVHIEDSKLPPVFGVI